MDRGAWHPCLQSGGGGSVTTADSVVDPSAPNRDPSIICTRCDSHLGNEEPGAWISMEALIVRGRSILREKKKIFSWLVEKCRLITNWKHFNAEVNLFCLDVSQTGKSPASRPGACRCHATLSASLTQPGRGEAVFIKPLTDTAAPPSCSPPPLQTSRPPPHSHPSRDGSSPAGLYNCHIKSPAFAETRRRRGDSVMGKSETCHPKRSSGSLERECYCSNGLCFPMTKFNRPEVSGLITEQKALGKTLLPHKLHASPLSSTV